jgi:nucleoside-diphosphate-sugar epimerase
VFTDVHVDIDTNLNKLVEVMHTWKRDTPNAVFNYISSWFVYGEQSSFPVKEDANCNPKGFYSITKRAAEQMLISYAETFGLKYRILRLSNVMGRYDPHASHKKNALTTMIAKLRNNEKISLYDEGSPTRDIIHIDDCTDAIETCRKFGELNDIYNISNSDSWTLNQIFDYYCNKYGCDKKLIEFIDTPKFHKLVQTKHMWMDNTKLKNLGYVPQYKIADAIDSIVDEIDDAKQHSTISK